MKFNSKIALSLFIVTFLCCTQNTWAKSHTHKHQGEKIGHKLDKAEKNVKKGTKKLGHKAHKGWKNVKHGAKNMKDDVKKKIHKATE